MWKLQLNLQNLLNWIDENRKLVLISLCVLIIVLMIALFFSIKIDKNNDQEIINLNYELKNEFVVPEEPGFYNDFYLSREKNEFWSEEDANKYFENPEGNLLEQLRDSNENLKNKIFEAVP